MTEYSNDEKRILLRAEEEYKYYNDNVKHFVNCVEIAFEATPRAVLVETRKAFGHISSAIISKNKPFEDRWKDLEEAHKHLRRVLLDCYKLLCIHEQDSIVSFKREFRFYNVSSLDDGRFLVELRKRQKEADNAFEKAKDADSIGKNSGEITEDDEMNVYEMYSVAIDKYSEVEKYINNHYDGMITLIKGQKLFRALSFLGWAVSIALAIVLFLLG